MSTPAAHPDAITGDPIADLSSLTTMSVDLCRVADAQERTADALERCATALEQLAGAWIEAGRGVIDVGPL